jgi:3-oxoacyl-(acyl-carrier-protein) synthase
MLKYMSGAAVLGCVAAREAMQQACVASRFPGERVGLYAGSGLAAADVGEVRDMISGSIDGDGMLSCRLLGECGLPSANPLLSFRILANMPACLISIIEGIKGPNLIFTPWEGQSAAALCEAWKAVGRGEADCAVAGAADSAAHPATVVYLRQSGVLGKDEYPASGAGYVVLERAGSALRDGRPIFARIADIRTGGAGEGIEDPLAGRIGRTYAAAPAIMLGLGALTGERAMSMRGVDGQRFDFSLETRP